MQFQPWDSPPKRLPVDPQDKVVDNAVDKAVDKVVDKVVPVAIK